MCVCVCVTYTIPNFFLVYSKVVTSGRRYPLLVSSISFGRGGMWAKLAPNVPRVRLHVRRGIALDIGERCSDRWKGVISFSAAALTEGDAGEGPLPMPKPGDACKKSDEPRPTKLRFGGGRMRVCFLLPYESIFFLSS